MFLSPDSFIDCVVIACWRRVQEWSIIPVVAEFRTFTWPHKLHDYEQFIELFNTGLVDIKTLSPESFVIHENIKVILLVFFSLFRSSCTFYACFVRSFG
jgi:hypothetical protein